MKLVMLGTSSGTPTKDRNVSALAVQFPGRWLLFDCGEGTQYRLMQTMLKPGQLDAVYLTHLHGDHVYGLPGLLGTLSLQHREQPLVVYGPPGLRELLGAVLRYSYLKLSFELKLVEVESGLVSRGDGYSVFCSKLDHRVTDYGYCVVEDDKPGKFNLERAKQLGIPAGPLYRQLQLGYDVTLADGRLIRSSEVVGEKRPGRRLVYCTDTRPCSAAVELAYKANLLIHEATYADDMAHEARRRGHSTARQAARIAAEAGVRKLLITHFSPRYLDVTPLLSEARSVFAATDAACDLMELEVEPW
ncbi:MAG: ribonuclease Z [Acidobacteriota bacterium]|nr:ribonuclease Z [Blastocatellia bacterium]MDW8412987.1 ribonuclease Z [Acidobacteriota bacterium]